MRRLILEFNYEGAWKQIFGSKYDKVEVLEAFRCFKCDTQGLALICKIRLKDRTMNVRELADAGLLTNVEALYRENDGSLVVFIEGETCVPQPGNTRQTRLLMTRPPEFLDVNRMKAICEQAMQYVQDSGGHYCRYETRIYLVKTDPQAEASASHCLCSGIL